jgi:polygalacturonase
MHTHFGKQLLVAMLLPGISSAVFAASSLATRPDDPKAVNLIAPAFGVHADGNSDDSAAIQAAIDSTRQELFLSLPAGIGCRAPS